MAQFRLYEELGFFDRILHANCTIKSYSMSFGKTGRLDSEYYQQKYEQLLNKITKLEYKKLGFLVKIKKSIEPGSDAYRDEGIPFVRVQDLSKWGISKSSVYLDSEYKDSIKPKKDTILFSKDGTCGIAYKVTENIEAITSGAILHLNIKDKNIVLPDYLTLLLNSIVGQMQAERDMGGSIINHWRIDQINNVIIPIIDIEKQREISKLLQQSFELRNMSELLLSDAITQVEKAIETGKHSS